MAARPVPARQRALTTLDADRDAEDPSLSSAGFAAASTTGIRGPMDASTIATVFLDSNFRITGYTPAAASLLLLAPQSIGRSLEEAALPLRYAEVNADAGAVLERLVPIEREVGHEGGNWFLARLLPYQTLEERAAGVVLSLVDITQRKRAEELSQWLSAVVASSMDAIVGFSLSGMVLSWNNGARHLFGYQASEMVGRSMERLVDEAHIDESIWILSQVQEHKSV
ncbi:MAG: putative histidine kinase, hybrid, partial [Variovorax sp.]|nr:putative histidine kinase, hybrid [Variovorax sp.]